MGFILTLSRVKGTQRIWSWIYDEDVDFDNLKNHGQIQSLELVLFWREMRKGNIYLPGGRFPQVTCSVHLIVILCSCLMQDRGKSSFCVAQHKKRVSCFLI